MIRETITFTFADEAQQKRFHERLSTPETADDDTTAVQAVRDRMMGIVQRAVLAERERCAAVAAGFAAQGDWNKDTAECIAASIREPLKLAVEP